MLKKSLLGLGLALILLGWWIRPIGGQTNTQTRTITLADLGYARDETLQGIRVARDIDLSLPDAWDVQPGNTLTLRFSHSSALRATSSMAVDWNGTRLASVLLTPDNATNGVLQVALPDALILKGYNRLRVEFYMSIREDICADVDNPAVWATLHNSSAFRLSYTPAPAVADLHALPRPFIDGSHWITNTVTFVLPNQPTPAELSAVATIAAKLGQWTAWRPLQLDAVAQEQNPGLTKIPGNLIVVGTADRLPTLPLVAQKDGRATLIDPQGQTIPADAGVLWEHVSPADSSAVMLVVTGQNDDALLTAARSLASNDAAARFAGSLGVVLHMPPITPDDKPPVQAITFDALGYRDVTSQGSREQTLNYILRLPAAWQVQDEATLDLHFAHSELLDANRSTLNVLLNDTPVGSILLTPKNSKEGRAAFQLPARLFHIGENRITINANIQLDKNYRDAGDCLDYFYREAWLVVYSDSQMNLPGNTAGFAATLANYPRAFVRSANLADVAFVVPTAPSIAIARAVALIAGGIGRSASADALFIPVVAAPKLDALKPAPVSQILVGRPSQNEAIARLNAVLPQPFKPNSDEPETIRAVAQIVPPQGVVGYLQTTLSADGQPRLVVTGNRDEGILWAAEALSDPNMLRKLKGDLAVLNSQGSVATAEIRKPASLPSLPTASAAANNAPRTPPWAIALASILFLATFVVLIIFAWRLLPRREARAKSEFSSGS